MLTTKDTEKRKQLKVISIEDLVPKDHLLRKVEAAIDFSFVREELKGYYSQDNGRPSIDPVVLIKLCIINYMYGLNSMRRTIRECEVNNAYRWFLGYDLLEPVPHFTTFGKNYNHRFADSDIFEKIFAKILDEAISCKLLDTNVIYIDGTHIKANANTKKNVKVQVQKESKHYKKQLLKEINADREKQGKKPFDDDDGKGNFETKTETKSTSDPESGLFHKGEHKKCFAYTAHTVCDKDNFVLHSEVTAGNIHDSIMFDSVYEKVKIKHGIPEAVVADAGYKTPWIAKQITDDLAKPIFPYKRPMGARKENPEFSSRNYIYDEYYDCYLCPNNQVLSYSTTNREGYREYKSKNYICENCLDLTDCTKSSNKTKVIIRHIWQNYIDYAEDIRHTPYGKELYATRGQTIERVFADAKEKHGMRYTRLKGLAKVKAQVLMTFSCMNLKKLIKGKEKLGLLAGFYSFLFAFSHFFKQLFQKNILISKKAA